MFGASTSDCEYAVVAVGTVVAMVALSVDSVVAFLLSIVILSVSARFSRHLHLRRKSDSSISLAMFLFLVAICFSKSKVAALQDHLQWRGAQDAKRRVEGR